MARHWCTLTHNYDIEIQHVNIIIFCKKKNETTFQQNKIENIKSNSYRFKTTGSNYNSYDGYISSTPKCSLNIMAQQILVDTVKNLLQMLP